MKKISPVALRYAKLLWYYAYKAIHRILSEIWCYLINGSRGPGLRYGLLHPKKGKPDFRGEVVFAFWNSSLVHLGDMLFHLPLADSLISQGYQLTILGGGGLTAYFQALGYRVVPLMEWLGSDHSGALIISKNDMFFEASRRISHPVYFLGLDYAAFSSSEPVTLALLRAAVATLDILDPSGRGQAVFANTKFAPRVPEDMISPCRASSWWQELSRDPSVRWLAFNPYVASNHLLVIGKSRMLSDLAVHKSKDGYKIVLTGSPEEKASDNNTYPFADLDLRGELKPVELIALFAHPQVEGSISFDTFAMHAASLSRKDLYVAIKNTFQAELFRKRFVPMFPGGEDLVKLCG